MFVNKRAQLLEQFDKTVAWFVIEMGSKKKSDCQGLAFGKEIDRLKRKAFSFYLAFILFHLVIGAISLWMIYFGSIPAKSELSHGSPPRNPCKRERMSHFENIYHRDFLFDFHAFLSEKGDGAFDQESQLIWSMNNLTYYGDFRLFFSFSHNVSVSKHLRNNGSLYLHIFLTKSGLPPMPRKDETCYEHYTVHKTKRLNFFWKSNENDIHSYWRPNWTLNLLVLDNLWELPFDEERLAKEPIIECNLLLSKYYPVLHLNDKFNLAKDCIQISQTTESLPLHLTFKETDRVKMEHYLSQGDFEDYFSHPNQTNAEEHEFVREKQIERDFENGYLFDHFGNIVFKIYVIKHMLVLLFEILICCIIGEIWGKSPLYPNHRMIFGNLIVFILLPLLPLYRLFSSYHAAFYAHENLVIFALLMLCNSIWYLSSAYWKSGFFFFGYFKFSKKVEKREDILFRFLFLMVQFGAFLATFFGQLAFLNVVFYNFNFVGFSVEEVQVLFSAWLLSDLASLIYLFELFIVKYCEDPTRVRSTSSVQN